MKTRQCSRLMIVNEQDELLLFQYKDEHKSEPFWATAGGELKESESYLGAAKRELYEETGLTNDIGELLLEREDIFAVARSTPAIWQEKYYLVRCATNSKVFAAQWTEEEKSTIQKWKWWSREEMEQEGIDAFKPDCLPALFDTILNSKLSE
ncbi:NUDIX hydrolase [Pseudoalteromonas luteoviolacea]|uniref:NUDIX hydrolase n=1 Tax=Pseudoalteromonas luteoviolacea TaxID=43657 RepID=UPI0005652BB5|nr:NUDIX domain-containing protein [Pseudoalteromonas luteoviolacea]